MSKCSRAIAAGSRDARAAAERMPARRGGARRHLLPDRPRATAKALGFDRPTANSLDSVSDRDFVLETLSAAAICRRRICRASPRKSCSGRRRNSASSRLSDKFTTGSSIMPQKRNPDAAELVRGKIGPHHRRARRPARS